MGLPGLSFNPLFIGSFLHTENMREQKINGKKCFNPLFIGSFLHTLKLTWPRDGSVPTVSIPYSSGHSFILFLFSLGFKFSFLSFNPLFIGSFLHTSRALSSTTLSLLLFQSPIHRVIPSYAKELINVVSPEECFNPLFIGSFLHTQKS